MHAIQDQTADAAATRAIVFADICKSTQLFERYGNERALQIVARTLALLGDVTARHGGEVVKTIGDEVMATFLQATPAFEAVAAMQQALKDDADLDRLGVAVKIGLHAGPVILERGDVFGDAVNVAARVTRLAKAEQILTTRPTVDALPDELLPRTRSLGHTRVRGKQDAIELCEVLWQQDRNVITLVTASAWKGIDVQCISRLVLGHGADEVVVESRSRPVQIGRGPENDLVVHGQRVSRTHATIEFSKGHFVLTDRSTNGTYVQMGDDEVLVHRGQIPLLGAGGLGFGHPVSAPEAEVVRFRNE